MISYVLPVLTQPRFRKRIRAFEEAGGSSQVFSFRRDYFKGDDYQSEYIDLGHIAHGMYMSRIFKLARAFRIIWRNARRSRIIYAFGLDCLLMAMAARWMRSDKVITVYEVGDIRPVLVGSSIASLLMRALERFLLRYVDYIVVTSKAYEDEYFIKIQGVGELPCILLENKVDSVAVPTLRTCETADHSDTLRIGYFGLLRCRKTVQLLQRLASDPKGQYSIYIRGKPLGLDGFDEFVNSSPRIEYGGEYSYPSELRSIYEHVDLVLIAHVHQEVNTRMARVNRFYESGYFLKPMIAQAGTQDGREVEELDCGLCIDLEDADEACRMISEISPLGMCKWRERLQHHKTRFCYSDEHESFYKKMVAQLL